MMRAVASAALSLTPLITALTLGVSLVQSSWCLRRCHQVQSKQQLTQTQAQKRIGMGPGIPADERAH